MDGLAGDWFLREVCPPTSLWPISFIPSFPVLDYKSPGGGDDLLFGATFSFIAESFGSVSAGSALRCCVPQAAKVVPHTGS